MLASDAAGVAILRARGGMAGVAFAEHAGQMALHIKAQQAAREPCALAGRIAVPLPHERFLIKEVGRALDEGRPLHARARGGEGVFDGGYEVAHPADALEEFHVRRNDGALVDVLQRAAPLQKRWRGSAKQHHGRLRHLRVLERGYGIGDARACGYGGHAWNAGQPCGGVGGENGGRFAARIDDADAPCFRARKDRRDVPAAEREQQAHAMCLKRRGDPGAAMPGRFDILVHSSFPVHQRPVIDFAYAGSRQFAPEFDTARARPFDELRPAIADQFLPPSRAWQAVHP